MMNVVYGRCMLFVSQYVNPAFERLLGYKCDELVGKSSYELTRSDFTKPDLINSISSQLRAGQVICRVHHLETISLLVVISCDIYVYFYILGTIETLNSSSLQFWSNRL